MRKIKEFISKHLDKIIHFLMNYAIVTLCSIMLTMWLPPVNACMLAVFAAVLCSVGKEIYDSKQPGNHFCWWDLLADLLGIILGILTYMLSVIF